MLDLIKQLSWYLIDSKLGKIAKANVPAGFTVQQLMSLDRQSFKTADGKEFVIGAVQYRRGQLQLTAFPPRESNSTDNTVTVTG